MNTHQAAWDIIDGDCLERLPELGEPARLIFVDPPYNQGIDYGPHMNDSRSDEEFSLWLKQIIAASSKALTHDGSLWILMSQEWSRQAADHADAAGLHLKQWITWYESFGVNCTHKFNRTTRPLLWFTKKKTRFVFNADAPEIRRTSARQRLGDKRACPSGKLWDDCWGIDPPIPRLVGNAKERLKGFPTQLPLALLRPIVACASDPGDLVIDPCSGSGTTGVACLELGRRFVGMELSEDFAKLSRRRLATTWSEKYAEWRKQGGAA